MNFNKYFILIALVLAVFAGQSQAGWLQKIGKRIERIGQQTRDAALQVVDLAQKAANVVATARG